MLDKNNTYDHKWFKFLILNQMVVSGNPLALK